MRHAWCLALAISVACAPSSDDDDDDDGSTTDECAACPLDPLVETVASASEQPPTDCGVVTWQDDVQAWAAAHDCVVAALDAETAVQLRWTPMGIDSVHYTVLVGATGESYAITEIDWDCYQGDVLASRTSCTDVVPTDGCTVEVGYLCLECAGPGMPTTLCE